MPYEVTVPELALLKQIGDVVDKDGKHVAYEHQTVLHYQGEIVEDEDVSPVVVDLYDSGDKHTRSVLKRQAKPRGKAKAADEEASA